MTTQEITEGLLRGDIRALSKAISLAESSKITDRHKAIEVLQLVQPKPSLRIGITGSPGVGKSSIIETLGSYVLGREQNAKLAVLSVDPSSSISRGSILGDKTRMNHLATHSRAYIRPSSSGNEAGGLARYTRLAMLLCEASGFDYVFIESVGVGQGETVIDQLCDVFVLVLNPGGGDELQGIKKGIMEHADLVLVNKADGANYSSAVETASEYLSALRFGNSKVPVLTVSAHENSGIDVLWENIKLKAVDDREQLGIKRKLQDVFWSKRFIREFIVQKLDQYDEKIRVELSKGLLPEVVAEQISQSILKD